MAREESTRIKTSFLLIRSTGWANEHIEDLSQAANEGEQMRNGMDNLELDGYRSIHSSGIWEDHIEEAFQCASNTLGR